MKALKIAKFHIMQTISAIRIYYMIFLLVIAFLAYLNLNSAGNVSSSGLEFTTVIFLFVTGLNSFRSNFKFSQANNISRKTFIKGLIVGIFPITLVMSAIDLVINRVYNIFVPCPTNFDMIYGSYRITGTIWENNTLVWSQSNDFYSIIGTIIWQFAVYSVIFLMGILISLIYYRSNNYLKVLVSISPVIPLIFSSYIDSLIEGIFNINIGEFIAGALGWQSRNPYIAVFTFGVLGVIFAGFVYLLTRRAVAKD